MAVRGVFVGLATLDVAQHVAQPPGPNEKATSTHAFVSAGGPAANAAVTFAALGGRATLVTGLGPDPAAELARTDLDQHAVDVVDLAPADGTFAASLSTIWVSATGERAIVGSDASGNVALAPPPDLITVLDGADVLLVDGHHPQLALRAVELTARLGVAVVVDIGRWKPVFDEVAARGAHAVCSEGARPPGAVGVDDLVAHLRERGAGPVVVTAGGEPVRVWKGAADDGDAPDAGPVTIEVPRVAALDTLGAGDAFHGAYAFEVAGGASPEAAARAAAGVAALRVQHRGPREWLRHLAPGVRPA